MRTRLQSKSLVFSTIGRMRSGQPQLGHVEGPEPLTEGNMQSLAAELHQSAQQGVFEYPRNWGMTAKCLSAVLLALAAAHLALVTMPLVRENPDPLLSGLANWSIVGALTGLITASAVSALLLNLFPSITITPAGLGISELFGTRHVAWEQVGVLRVMELQATKRYVVMIPLKGATFPSTPAPMLRIIPALVGASRGGERGIVVTSDMKNFERLLQLIMAYMAQAAGMAVPNVEAFLEEDAVMPVAQLLLEPGAAMARMSRHASSMTGEYGLTTESTEPQVSWPKVMRRQAVIAAVPALCLLLDVLVRNGERPVSWMHPLWAVALFVIGLAELPFVARLVQAVGELLVGSGQFNIAALAYRELQGPRTLLLGLGVVLMGIGAPPLVAQGLWLVGILVTTALTTRFVQKLYYMPVMHALLASLGTFIFQMSVLALYFGVR